ncbi:MAG TPA: hypothetical protein VG820_12780, partial [Fimbriimonadaceae bacterium]|nr:hypothetical protein [Fimbriimonadaceae bacterium]
ASLRQFDEILKEHLASQTSVKYLRLQDQCFGRVERWDPNTSVHGTDSNWSMGVHVVRAGAEFNEDVGGSDPHFVYIALRTRENDEGSAVVGDPHAANVQYPSDNFTVGDLQPGPRVTSAAEAMNAVRPLIHHVDSQFKPSGLKATETADYWVIHEYTKSGTRLLVLSKSGEQVEHVWASGRVGYYD